MCTFASCIKCHRKVLSAGKSRFDAKIYYNINSQTVDTQQASRQMDGSYSKAPDGLNAIKCMRIFH